VAYEVARSLGAPFDVMLVRKIRMPGQRELAIGAIAAGNITVRDERIADLFGDGGRLFKHLAKQEHAELERHERVYRTGLAPLDLKGKTVILVDDGLATGSTMLAAVRASQQLGAASVVIAAPVASRAAAALLGREADKTFILQIPKHLSSIGEWYERFEQLEDADLCKLLQDARAASQLSAQ
jgi:predicted phosphoribosyltransferase